MKFSVYKNNKQHDNINKEKKITITKQHDNINKVKIITITNEWLDK